MKLSGIVCLSLTLCIAATGQITFNKTIDFQGGFEFPISVIELDSGYVLMGNGHNFPLLGGWMGCVFVKTDINGEVVSSNYYGKEYANYLAGVEGSFVKLKNMAGYAVGVTEFDSIRNNFKAVIIRYNEMGDTVFLKRYGGTPVDAANQLIETRDTGFAFVGKTNISGYAFYFVKTDSTGNMEWQKTYVPSSNSKGISVTHALDGGYIMSGWGYTPGYDIDTYIVKTDSTGNEKWKKRYGTKNEDGGAFILPSSDSTYIVFGVIDTFNLTTTIGQPLKSRYIIKIDLTGGIVWRYITDYNWYQQLGMVREVAPGAGYIAVGQTYDEVFGSRNAYGWIIRMDNDGNILWERKYAYPNANKPNGLAFSSLYDVRPTRDGGFICLGFSIDANQDFWLLKLDSLGCMDGYCGLTDSSCYYKPYPDCEDDTVGIKEAQGIEYQDARLLVYPNPAEDIVFFYPTSRYAGIKQISLYNSQGKLITTKQHSNQINIGDLPAGMYYYETTLEDALLPSQDQHPVRGKIIKN